jgi:hypothetical protein
MSEEIESEKSSDVINRLNLGVDWVIQLRAFLFVAFFPLAVLR